MKKIINYFRQRRDERLRARIALKRHYGTNELAAVHEFIKRKLCPSKTEIGGGYIGRSTVV